MPARIIRLGARRASVHHLADRLADAADGLTARVAGWLRDRRRLAEMRATQRELAGLDDATLRDLGVSPNGVSAWAAEVHGLAPTSLARLEGRQARRSR